ncbi:MAG: thiamine pyrophosphate-binding protein [Pseudomonadota bacterium]
MALERPVRAGNVALGWGSDALALALRNVKLPYIALNPGASYRGLHDSIVNFLGNEQPQMLLCLHEEHAVAIAHGYAKVSGQPMAVALHSNVGLMHASMAIFNAWCDRVPMVLVGATGPVDAALRRPWIDWIHTARDQGALIRHFTKWDDQPASVPAAFESVYRAAMLARTPPCGPVYVCFDAALQEAPIDADTPVPDAARFQPAAPPRPAAAALERAAALLTRANNPFLLAGRVSRDPAAWKARVALAEMLGARVLTDLKLGAAFPTDHPLHAAPPVFFLPPAAAGLLKGADAILSLEWLDLAGTLKSAWGEEPPTAKIVHVSNDLYLHNGWSMDHQGLPPVDVALLADPDTTVPLLLEALAATGKRTARAAPGTVARPDRPPAPGGDKITLPALAAALQAALGGEAACLVRLPLGWPGECWHFRAPLDFLGYDGGAGVGSGPGLAVGAALALKDSGRMPVAVIGDGDYLMGAGALWTAARYRIPLLAIVANNRSFFNDELHQERVARRRARPVENRWIGQRIADPDIDLAGIARAKGLAGIGPVERPQDLGPRLREAVGEVRRGRACVVDVVVLPQYEDTMAKAMVREGAEG